MTMLENQRNELELEIQNLGYESLRFSIFNDHRPLEWETRIEFSPENKEYEVYSTMDRASKGGIYKFSNFKEAKKRFLKNLEVSVYINTNSVKNEEIPEYSSPLWDKSEEEL